MFKREWEAKILGDERGYWIQIRKVFVDSRLAWLNFLSVWSSPERYVYQVIGEARRAANVMLRILNREKPVEINE